MALNGLFCADVPLRNYSLTRISIQCRKQIKYRGRPILFIPVYRVPASCCLYVVRLSL